MRKVILFILLIISISITFTYCAKKNVKDPETIVLVLPNEPQTLNPVSSLDLYSSRVIGFIYDSLMNVDKDLNFIPKIIDSYSVSKDSKIFTFKIKTNVYWHDGTQLTAEDIVYTYSMITNPISKAFNKVAQYENVENVKLIDKFTFQVRYKKPYSPAIESWALTPIPKHIFEKEDFQNSSYNRNPVGCGPYRLVKWIPGQYLVLEKVTNYWDKENEPKIKRIIFRIINEPSVEFNALKTKQVDIASIRPIDWINQATKEDFREKFNTYEYYTLNISQIALNLKDEILSDISVRKAIAHALNKKAILENVFYNLALPLTGPFPPNSWAFNPGVKDYEFELSKSKELLSKAGWKDTDNDGILDKNGKKLEIELLVSQGSETGIKIAEILKSDLEKIGVVLKIRVLDWSAVSKKIDSKDFQAVMFGWSLSIDPDPYDIWHSSQINKGINFVSYSNATVDKLCEMGREIFDKNQRKKIYAQIHQIIRDELPYIFLFSRASTIGSDKRIKGIDPSTAGIFHNFEKWSIEK